VHDRIGAEAPRRSLDIALDDEIEIARLAADQDVADGAANDPDPRDVPQCVERGLQPGLGMEPVQEVVGAHTATIAVHVVAG
jgi:hypothetical protein